MGVELMAVGIVLGVLLIAAIEAGNIILAWRLHRREAREASKCAENEL